MRDISRKMDKRLYIATICSSHRELLRQYRIGIELDQFCMAANMTGEGRAAADREISELKKYTQNVILHAPFNELFPAAIDPEARALAMKRFNEAAQIAMECGADKMVVHSGYVPFIYFKEWHNDRSVEFWEEFMADKPDGFKIAIENVLDDEPYMMAEMMSRITNPNIRLCLDTGHALCVSKVPVMEWLEVTAPYLGHLHIHNNGGLNDEHLDLPDGQLDMEAFLDRTTEICRHDTTITLETRGGRKSLEWLEAKGYLSPESVR